MSSKRTVWQAVGAFVFDCDGVLTDGSVTIDASGKQMRTLSTRDGYALQLAVKKGLEVCIISGADYPPLIERFSGLGIDKVMMGARVKTEALAQFCTESGVDCKDVLYMGDDLPDVEAMIRCGCRCCPSDAAAEVQALSHYVSDRRGGHGCVRDVVERVLRAKGLWPVFDTANHNSDMHW